MNKKMTALLLGLALLFTLAGCGSDDAALTPPSGVAVQVKTAERGDIATENRVSGSVASDDETSIYVASAAKCTAVYVQAGDTVKKGQAICKLDLDSTQASYNAAKISYESSAESYAQQKEVFDRQLAVLDKQIALYEKTLADTKELFSIGAASQLEIDQADLQLESARLQRASTEAQRDATLSQLEAGMENTRSGLEQLQTVMDDVDASGNVIAPASGTLASLTATEGGFVSPNYPVAVISNAEEMKVTVSVSESLVPRIAIGDTARVSVAAANGTEFTGVIRSVEQTANVQTKLYTVVISVPHSVEGLISGMFADVTFYTDVSEDAVTVPSEAILTSNGEQYVFLVEDGAAVRSAVTTGIHGDGVTEILSGVEAGQQVVVIGQQYLSDGSAVRVVDGG
ncbi:MAG: efflux RND transporter periplasmic adaptor subunit [Oscillibacter sp.]|nr:efflux RND transporter periplasmic adaptor subunit [Oscillibacter sp.]